MFAIGDIQGCSVSLADLFRAIGSGDHRYAFVGDLVNRGPESLSVLRQIRDLGDRAEVVLGNHDIHLLAVAAGVRPVGRSDTLDEILGAPERDELLEWLRYRRLAIQKGNFLLVHAGVLPQWSASQVIDLARDVEEQLQGPNWQGFLADIFGNAANRWHSLAEFASSRRSPEAGTSAGPITNLALILGARKIASSDCSSVVSPM
ncbi:Bis(5'-nucleosyl)-tetraphosphatase, symmetrical [compost metagenome]